MNFKEFDVPLIPVDISEWGCTKENPNGGEPFRYEKCFVRPLTVSENGEFTKLASEREPDGTDLSLAKVVVRFAFDEAGKRIFSPDDLADIAKNDIRPARRIVEKLWDLNTIPREELDTLKKS
jgi:hypothetical protein